jgi:hypothetical protein
MTKHPSTKSTRKHPIVAVMQVATGSRSRSGGGHALPNHQTGPSSVDVGVPAWGRHLCVPVQSAFARRGCRSEGWGADYRKGKLSRQSRTAGTSATSSSFLSASASESTRNRGAAHAAAASGAGWTSLAGMAGYQDVNRSWSVPSRVRVRVCRRRWAPCL